jgi:hypothetical protein
MEAVAEEARKEGLTVEGAKSAVGGTLGKSRARRSCGQGHFRVGDLDQIIIGDSKSLICSGAANIADSFFEAA